MRCYRRFLGLSCTEHVTYDEVHRRIEAQIGPFVDLLTAVKRRKLRWYGHVTRSHGLFKTVLQETVQWGRHREGQRKQCVDKIEEWTGLTFAKSQTTAQDCDTWRKIVHSIYPVPS